VPHQHAEEMLLGLQGQQQQLTKGEHSKPQNSARATPAC
jgi:hypothetical protein